MQPWSLFQVNEAKNVFFMILRSLVVLLVKFIGLNLFFRWVEKLFGKSYALYLYQPANRRTLHFKVRKYQPKKTLKDKLSGKTLFGELNAANNDFSPSKISSFTMTFGCCYFRKHYYALPCRWINLCTRVIKILSQSYRWIIRIFL